MLENNRILHLILKRKWWDMIASGEKKEEYRDITSFYSVRFFIKGDWLYLKHYMDYDEEEVLNVIKSDAQRSHMNIRWQPYDAVTFHLGYTNTTMTFEIEGISIGKGREEWGAEPNTDYFVIKLGQRQ